MRTIEYSSAFKRDYKRAKATPQYGHDLDALLSAVLTQLIHDRNLPDSNRDHALKGDWAGYRDISDSEIVMARNTPPTLSRL